MLKDLLKHCYFKEAYYVVLKSSLCTMKLDYNDINIKTLLDIFKYIDFDYLKLIIKFDKNLNYNEIKLHDYFNQFKDPKYVKEIIETFEYYGPIDTTKFLHLPYNYLKNTLIVDSLSSISNIYNFLNKVSNINLNKDELKSESNRYIISIDTERKISTSSLVNSVDECSLIQLSIVKESTLLKSNKDCFDKNFKIKDYKNIATILIDEYTLSNYVYCQSKKAKHLLTDIITNLIINCYLYIGFALVNDTKYILKYINNKSLVNNLKKKTIDFSTDNKHVESSIDINFITSKSKTFGNSLKSICKNILNIELCKASQLANWDERPLMLQHIHYSSLDSYILLLIYKKLYIDYKA